MVKLVTKKSKHENSDCCELFLTLISAMSKSFASEKDEQVRPFNPTIFKCDEHISNYIGIEAYLKILSLRKEQQVVNITLRKV